MKKLISFIIALTISGIVTAQTYSVSESNGTSLICKGCKVTNPSDAVGNNLSNASMLKVSNYGMITSYVYQSLNFGQTAAAGSQVSFIISDDKMNKLGATNFSNISFYTFGSTYYTDEIDNAKVTIMETSVSGKYEVSFRAEKAFYGAGIVVYSRDSKEDEKTIKVYGAFFTNIALPVELISFTGESNNAGHILKWTTASEKNNSGFTVEKSTDGITFEATGKVSGNGTTNVISEYTFTDKDENGNTYYRLAQTDINGTTTYFSTIYLTAVATEKELAITSANPFENAISFGFSMATATIVDVRILDMNGNNVYQQSADGLSGYNEITVNGLDQIPGGVYNLIVITEGNTMTARIIK